MENNPSLKIVLEISFLSSCIFSFEYLIPAGARYNDNIKRKIDAITVNIRNGFRVLKLLIPDDKIIIDSLSLPILFKTNTVEIKSAKGRIWARILGITDIVKLKNTGILAPRMIASSSILSTCVSHARDNIAIQTITNEIKSFLIIYLSILAIALRLYTTYHRKVIVRFLVILEK